MEILLIDNFIIVTIVASIIIGIVRGATKELLSIASWLGSAFLSFKLFDSVQNIARSYINHTLIADFVAICTLFIVFLLTFSIINYACSNFVKKSLLGGVDRFLGFIFGFLRGIAILVLGHLAISQWIFVDQLPKELKDSKFYEIVIKTTNIVIALLPKNWQDVVVKHMSKLNKENIAHFLSEKLDKTEKRIAETEAKSSDLFIGFGNQIKEKTHSAEEEAEYLSKLMPMHREQENNFETAATQKDEIYTTESGSKLSDLINPRKKSTKSEQEGSIDNEMQNNTNRQITQQDAKDQELSTEEKSAEEQNEDEIDDVKVVVKEDSDDEEQEAGSEQTLE